MLRLETTDNSDLYCIMKLTKLTFKIAIIDPHVANLLYLINNTIYSLNYLQHFCSLNKPNLTLLNIFYNYFLAWRRFCAIIFWTVCFID